jgi:site-specific DNA recombinase
VNALYAIYARQSVDRPDSISIESQIEYCRYETKGEEYKEYIDRGYSGKNTDRPMLQELLADIEKGRITKIIVYKLDRISRSILDFSNLMEKLQRYQVEFISSTEKFDTSTPMGRAALNICIVFAQLERETIQKRVADAYHSRSIKSLYMGGRVPYGFRLTDTVIDGIATSKYEIIPEEAKVLQLMFERYAKPNISFGDIIKYFSKRGILNRGKPWNRVRIGDYIRNPIYVKADASIYDYYNKQGTYFVNDSSDFIGTNGCYYYKKKDNYNPKSECQGNCLVLAPHEGIIEADVWLLCQTKLIKNKQLQPVIKSKNTWLAGKVKCGICGYAMVLKQYPERRIKKGNKHDIIGQISLELLNNHNHTIHMGGHSYPRYFLCSHRLNTRACEGPGTIYGDELEEIIYQEIKQKMKEFTSITKLNTIVDQKNLLRLKTELLKRNNEINSLMDKLPSANDVLTEYINRRISQLHMEQQAAEHELEDIVSVSTENVPVSNIRPDISNWDKFEYRDKKEIIDLLIDIVHVKNNEIEIKWRI